MLWEGAVAGNQLRRSREVPAGMASHGRQAVKVTPHSGRTPADSMMLALG